MKKLTYLAVLQPTETGYSVYFPDVPGCITVGSTIQESSDYAKEALELHIYGMQKDNEEVPVASESVNFKLNAGDMVMPITIYPDLVTTRLDNRKVKTNCSIPAWLKNLAEQKHVNYSQLLEASLKDVLAVK